MTYLPWQAHSFTPELVNERWEAHACNTSVMVHVLCEARALNQCSLNVLLEPETSLPALTVHVLEGWGKARL